MVRSLNVDDRWNWASGSSRSFSEQHMEAEKAGHDHSNRFERKRAMKQVKSLIDTFIRTPVIRSAQFRLIVVAGAIGLIIRRRLQTLYFEKLLRKYSILGLSPSRNGILGAHPNWACASEMSGLRCLGSSCGSGRVTSGDRDPVSEMI